MLISLTLPSGLWNLIYSSLLYIYQDTSTVIFNQALCLWTKLDGTEITFNRWKWELAKEMELMLDKVM